ncbi:MAG: hypothetical protein C4541_04905 [Candidatus Auribacter fodinae]|uniref:Uncharacterized protein n=1 Tax=Candidatus Auribacter fodinae TaxID=2093366 RepID=A0A3A4R552_9BACT|nr:MAG: hypothetical protein C4541_04905 [Candidatus Auribacter fodinae]
MLPKILITILTVIFTELFLLLYQNYRIADFIPISETLLNQNGIAAYDFFIIFTVLLYRVIYRYFGITIFSLKQIIASFRNTKLIEIACIAGGVFVAYFFISPFLYGIFRDPINVIRSSNDSLRKAVIFQLPLLWLFLVYIINTIFSSFNSAGNPSGNNVIPQPPNWP